nr:DNA (cytosine-5-)-methyltransferase [Frigoribacterium sp. VKM Ac-1396]
MPEGAPKSLEFFAGIGLARAGLEEAGLPVQWSNDISSKKAALFNSNFGKSDSHVYRVGDVGRLAAEEFPPASDLAWASFPCTDLSLAGGRDGLRGSSSSAFWSFVKILARMGSSKPRVLAIENVTAFVSSRSGKDITAAIRALNGLGYSVDVLNIDARRFIPQSRPRLFLVAELGNQPDAETDELTRSPLRPPWLDVIFDNEELRTHQAPLPNPPELLDEGFTALSLLASDGTEEWWSEERVAAFWESLSVVQSVRMRALLDLPKVSRRTAFRRMRLGKPTWEVRAGDVAGCLRTSSGGSSRQAVVEAAFGELRVRWMTPREYAHLMGAPDYKFGKTPTNDVLTGFGDAVCVPVVQWLAENYIRPRLAGLARMDPVLSSSFDQKN